MPSFTEEEVRSLIRATVFDGKVVIAYTTKRAGRWVLSLLHTTDFHDWKQIKPPDGMSWCFSLFSFQDHLYGSFRNDNYPPKSSKDHPVLHQLVDMISGEWRQLPNGRFRHPQLGHASVVWEEKLWVVGGHDGKTKLTTVEVYDLIHHTWCDRSQYSPLPVVLSFGKGIIHNGQLHITGGYTQKQSKRDGDMIVYTSTLSSASTPPQHRWISDVLPATPHGQCGVLSLEDCPVVAGGYAEYQGTQSSEVFCLDVDNKTWLQLPCLPTSRSSPSLLQYGDKLVALGGYDPRSSINLNTVEVMQLTV